MLLKKTEVSMIFLDWYINLYCNLR